MRYITILAILCALFAVFAARDVSAGEPYVIEDATKPGEEIIFFWTKNDVKMEDVKWKLTVKCGNVTASRDDFIGEYKVTNTTNGTCKFWFTAPAGATDWHQTINGKNGATKTYTGNIKQNSPWTFEELTLLPRNLHEDSRSRANRCGGFRPHDLRCRQPGAIYD